MAEEHEKPRHELPGQRCRQMGPDLLLGEHQVTWAPRSLPHNVTAASATSSWLSGMVRTSPGSMQCPALVAWGRVRPAVSAPIRAPRPAAPGCRCCPAPVRGRAPAPPQQFLEGPRVEPPALHLDRVVGVAGGDQVRGSTRGREVTAQPAGGSRTRCDLRLFERVAPSSISAQDEAQWCDAPADAHDAQMPLCSSSCGH